MTAAARSARVGVVLAGGRSTRFGDREKALVELDGRPLLVRAVEGVAPAVDAVVVNCRRDQVAPFRSALDGRTVDVAFAVDPTPDRGPAAGLAAGLSTVAAPLVAVVTCDAPYVDSDFLERLFERAAVPDVDEPAVELPDAVVPRIDGHRQPTRAVYRTGPARRAARMAVERGNRSLQATLDELDVDALPEQDVLELTAARSFADVNEPADLRSLREYLREEER